MTISNEISRSGPYEGNGVTVDFDYDFKIADASHIQVVVADELGTESILELTTDYSVVGVGEDDGYITLVEPLPEDHTLVCILSVPFTQETDLENQGPYFAEVIESALDLAAQRSQQLAEVLERCVRVPATATTENLAQLIGYINLLGQSAADIATIAGISEEITAVAGMAEEVAAVPGAAASAEAAAAAAATSETNTATSAATATSAKNDAVTAKNDAVTAKDAAVTAKTSAETAATTSTTQATNASASATTASTAKDDAVTAKNTAVAAAASASADAGTATAAKNTAVTAKNDAVTAKDAAQAAQAAAEQARDEAQDASAGIGSLIEDTSPQLGGDLDLNGKSITGAGDVDITGDVSADTVTADALHATAATVNGSDVLTKDFIDTTGTLGDSDDVVPSQKAVKTAINALLPAADAVVIKGGIDCSANPNFPAADAGHQYRVTVAGKIGGASGANVEVMDVITCFVDSTAAGNLATVGANWIIQQSNIDGAVTTANIASSMATAINAGTSKGTPVDADALALWDSVAAGFKKLTWANAKATLKSYFDTLYAGIGYLTAATTTVAAYLSLAEGTNNGASVMKVTPPAAMAADRTVTFQDASGTPALLDVAAQALSGGARVTTYDNGTKSSSTFTPDPGNGPHQKATNNGAHTLAPGSNYGSYWLDYTNGASAGAITTSGWTKVVGDSFTTTNGHKFACMAHVSELGSLLIIQAMQ